MKIWSIISLVWRTLICTIYLWISISYTIFSTLNAKQNWQDLSENSFFKVEWMERSKIKNKRLNLTEIKKMYVLSTH